MPKQWFRLIGLAFAAILIVVGCQATTPQVESKQPVVIHMSGWGANPIEQKLLQQVLESFAAEHPQIQVKFEVIADQFMDVLKTRLIGDAAPDVFYLDALEAPFLMANHVLEPLESYITPEFDLADFAPNLLAPFQYQGHTFGLPKDYSTLALFYNKKAFSRAGVPKLPATWDELVADARLLTRDTNQDGKVDQYGLGIVPELARQAYTIRAFGGEVVTAQSYAAFASDQGRRGLQLLVNQYRTDRTSVRPLDMGTNSTTELFGQEKAAMVIEGNWAIPFLADTFPQVEYGTAEVPTMNHQAGTMLYTVAYVMNRQSRHKPEAWQLIAYLTGKKGMTQWAGSGFALPTRKSVADTFHYAEEPLRSALVAGVKYATPWQAGMYPSAVMNHFNNQFISVMLGEQALQPAMQAAQTAANQQIQASE